MSLQVWLPLNGNLNNQGLSDITITNSGATVDSSGKIGKCYFCSSASYLYTNNFYLNTESFSVAYWVKYATIGSWNTYIVSLNNSTNEDYQFMIGSLGGADNTSSSTNLRINAALSGRISIPKNEWHHCCATWQNNTVTIYVDGKKDSIFNGVAVNSGATHLNINCRSTSTSGAGYGVTGLSDVYVNDIRIYDHCLSAKEVKEISRGLSLHYKLSDPYIESTTNLYNGWSSNCYNAVTGNYYYGTGTDMYYDTLDDGTIKVRMGTDSIDAWPLVFFSNLTPPSSGEYRTISFDYFPSIIDTVQFYSYGTPGTINWIVNGVYGSGGDIPVNINSWNHISVTIKNTGTSSDGFGFMKIGTAKHTSSTSNYWLFKNIQIESKDHSTGYTSAGTSRSESLCFDSSGFSNNGVVKNQSSISIEGDSPRYGVSTVFNGTPFIVGQNLDGAKSTDALSLCAWINPSQVSGGYDIISSYEGGGAGLHITSGNIYFQIYSNGYIAVLGGSVSANTWYHVVGTYDNSKLRIYVNGKLKGEVAKTGNITYNSGTPWAVAVNPSGTSGGDGEYFYGKLSDVRIYSTALSASDIKELYNTSASIDKNGNMYAYEFKEE